MKRSINRMVAVAVTISLFFLQVIPFGFAEITWVTDQNPTAQPGVSPEQAQASYQVSVTPPSGSIDGGANFDAAVSSNPKLAPTVTPVGSAYNGVDDYLTIHDDSYGLQNGAVSIGVWVKLDKVDDQMIIARAQNTVFSSSTNYQTAWNTNDVLAGALSLQLRVKDQRFVFGTSEYDQATATTKENSIAGKTVVQAGKWYFLTAVVKEAAGSTVGAMQLYVNGREDGTKVDGITKLRSNPYVASWYYVGRGNFDVRGQFLEGTLAGLTIEHSVISASTVHDRFFGAVDPLAAHPEIKPVLEMLAPIFQPTNPSDLEMFFVDYILSEKIKISVSSDKQTAEISVTDPATLAILLDPAKGNFPSLSQGNPPVTFIPKRWTLELEVGTYAVKAGTLRAPTPEVLVNQVTLGTSGQTMIVRPGPGDFIFNVGIAGQTYFWFYRALGAAQGQLVQQTASPMMTMGNPADGIYWCTVAVMSNGIASAVESQKVEMVRPTATTQPTAQTVRDGAKNISMTFEADSKDPNYYAAYQWYRNGVAIAGATQNIYNLAAVSEANAGNYYCMATNTLGQTVSSQVAALTVVRAPVIASQSQGTIQVDKGGTQTLSVTAQSLSGGVLKYQWYHNGEIIQGADAATHIISNATGVARGTYDCVVTTTVDGVESDETRSATAVLSVDLLKQYSPAERGVITAVAGSLGMTDEAVATFIDEGKMVLNTTALTLEVKANVPNLPTQLAAILGQSGLGSALQLPNINLQVFPVVFRVAQNGSQYELVSGHLNGGSGENYELIFENNRVRSFERWLQNGRLSHVVTFEYTSEGRDGPFRIMYRSEATFEVGALRNWMTVHSLSDRWPPPADQLAELGIDLPPLMVPEIPTLVPPAEEIPASFVEPLAAENVVDVPPSEEVLNPVVDQISEAEPATVPNVSEMPEISTPVPPYEEIPVFFVEPLAAENVVDLPPSEEVLNPVVEQTPDDGLESVKEAIETPEPVIPEDPDPAAILPVLKDVTPVVPAEEPSGVSVPEESDAEEVPVTVNQELLESAGTIDPVQSVETLSLGESVSGDSVTPPENDAPRVIVDSVNGAPPVMNDQGDVVVEVVEGEGTVEIPLTVTDEDAPAAGATLSVVSSTNTDFVPEENVTFGGSEEHRTIQVNPTANQESEAESRLTIRAAHQASNPGLEQPHYRDVSFVIKKKKKKA